MVQELTNARDVGDKRWQAEVRDRVGNDQGGQGGEGESAASHDDDDGGVGG